MSEEYVSFIENINKRAEAYRQSLDNHFKHIMQIITFVSLILGGLFAFFLYKSYDGTKEYMAQLVTSRFIDNSIDGEISKRVDLMISNNLNKQIDSKETLENIDKKIENIIDTKLLKQSEDIIRKKLRELENQKSVMKFLEKTRIPDNAVLSFMIEDCPPGWDDYEPAYGRFVRGIDKSKSKIDPSGQRDPGNLQDSSFESHYHTLNKPVRVHRNHGVNTYDDANPGNWVGDEAVSTTSAGSNETRPKNVALLFCIRKPTDDMEPENPQEGGQ